MSNSQAQYLLVGWLFVVALGVLLGLNKRIIVFRNYNDMAVIFCSGLMSALAAALWLGFEGKLTILAFFCTLLAVAGFVWAAARSFIDNRNPLYALIALVTKLSLFLLFVSCLIDVVTPTGKTAERRASTRRLSFVIFLAIAPLTAALVKEHSGLFSPNKSRRDLW